MRSNNLRFFGTTILMLAVTGMPALARTHKPGTKKTAAHSSRFSHIRKAASWKHHGQQQISSDRAREIQEALIREHYLDGQPTGVWDGRTEEAMRHFQAAQGWQSKVVPDSRALIKLGLGPSHENDLNPDLMGDKTGNSIFKTADATGEIPQR